MILIQQCQLFAPEAQGVRDVLIAGGHVVAIETEIPPPVGLPVRLIDGHGLRLILNDPTHSDLIAPLEKLRAKALLAHSTLDAKTIVESSLKIAGEICIYTNTNIKVETL